MDELPENLKTEQVPKTSENYSNNIKERLNLHVKRRLLHEAQPATAMMPLGAAATSTSNNDEKLFKNNQKAQLKEKQNELPRTRRPYQKRLDKTNKITTIMSASSANTPAATTPDCSQGKRRQKSKATAQQQQNATHAAITGGFNEMGVSPIIGVRSEDDGSHDGLHEMETRTSHPRDKEKCPDVLGMILSMKRRALLENTEVHEFLRKIVRGD